jgi:hypothetical protein
VFCRAVELAGDFDPAGFASFLRMSGEIGVVPAHPLAHHREPYALEGWILEI